MPVGVFCEFGFTLTKYYMEIQHTWLQHCVISQSWDAADQEMNWLSWFFLQGHSHLQIFGSAKRTIDSVGFLLCLCSRLSLRLVALIKMRSLLKLLVVFFFLLWNVKSHFIASSARLTCFSLKGEWVRVSERERASQRESERARERERERERFTFFLNHHHCEGKVGQLFM